jgi:hypothetical protein
MTVRPDDQERANLAAWMKEQIERIEAAHRERVQILRTVGEHPSPIFSAMVKQHAYAGLPQALIAKLMCCSVSTLLNHYADELDLGKAELISAVGMNMARIATSTTDPNNAKVGMDILNRRGGEEWKPPAQKVEFKPEASGPPVIDSSKLTREERDQLRIMLTRIAEGGEGEPQEGEPQEGVEPLIGEVDSQPDS